MYEQKILQTLEQYFQGYRERGQNTVYFYRISGYSESVGRFLREYYTAARQCGAVIEGRIPNPDEKNLAYFAEIMGNRFQLSAGFLESSLQKWLPRLNPPHRRLLAAALYDVLTAMGHEGKNENILKNAYVKFMCWLYYRFENVVSQLGREKVPKILYEGKIGAYELKMLSVLSRTGCDVLLLQLQGDQEYLKLDPSSSQSHAYSTPGLSAFPKGYCIQKIQKEIEQEQKRQRLYGGAPAFSNCTNAWIEGSGFADFLKDVRSRGTDPGLFYNCFCKINGVEDKLTYLNELYQFQLQLKAQNRRIVIVENGIPLPTTEEIARIERKSYKTQEDMLEDLSKNIRRGSNSRLCGCMIRTFVDLMTEEGKEPGINLNKLTGRAVYLLCWLNRYQPVLFEGWMMPEVACFICLGSCKNESEVLFLKFLSRLPVDVLILNPDMNFHSDLSDPFLYELSYEHTLEVEHFPTEQTMISMGTAAYHAERELDTLIYQDSGMYRSFQYQKAVSVTLRTMYEEIALLWDQELKYRPNFSVVNGVVNIPVLFAKVSGVKDGQVRNYWNSIQQLITEDTIVVTKAPYLSDMDPNPARPFATEFFKNGRLQRGKIKAHKTYSYGFLREEVQDYLLDKLQLLIDRKLIKGTFENGTEYTICSTVLNLKQEIIRMIQKFDFTKKNPKLIYIHTTESLISLEDSIMAAFLNLVGFDVVFFVPTGYQNVEKFFQIKMLEEHQIGEYVYDLHPPSFDRPSGNTRRSWRDILFRRGD